MPTEIQEKPSTRDNQLQDSQSGDNLRPDLDDYEDYNQQSRTNSSKGASEAQQIKAADGSLIIKPIFGRKNESVKPDGSEADTASTDNERVDSQTNNQVNAQTDHQVDGQIDKQVKAQTDNQVDGQSDNQANAQTDNQVDGQSDNQANAQTDNQVNSQIEKPDLSDQSNKEIKDGEEVTLSPETQKAKDEFVKIFKERFENDPRVKDNPDLVKTLEARMSEMDQRVLHERVQQADGSLVNQQEQLANVYGNFNRIAKDAEKLTYTAKDGSKHQVFNQQMVNNLLAGGIMRGADPVHFYNQGANNTCAAESINRQGNKLLAGDDSKTIADICTKGEFEAVDNKGKKFICRVDKESLSADREGENIYLDQTNARDLYGKAGDIRTAQLNLDLMSREKASQWGQDAGEGNLVYSKGPAEGQRDTGERVTDIRTGEVVANSPCLDAKGVSDTKQSLYGGRLGKTFGKDTTLVSERAFDVPNATAIRSGAQLKAHLNTLKLRGWDLATGGTHIGRYVDNAQGLGGAQGWHATSFRLNDKGGIDFINNWGKEKNFDNLNADTLFSWMNAPNQRRGDHVFDPDGVYVHDDGNPVRSALAKDRHVMDQNIQKKEEDNVIAQLRKAQQREEENNQKQMQYSRTKLAEVETQLAGLSPGSSEWTNLIKQKQIYENNTKLI